MKLSELRFIADHLPGRVPSQAGLLSALENKGYETGKNRILTTRAVGIPVTIYVLLTRDAIASLEKEQHELEKAKLVVAKYTTPELSGKLGTNVAAIYPGANLQATTWLHTHPWKQSAETAAISGCAMIQQTNFVQPAGGSLNSPNPAISLPANLTAYKGGLEFPEADLPVRPMIEIFKSTFFAIESIYALSERISHEIDNFNKAFSASLIVKVDRGNFDGMCSRRGALVHTGDLAIKVDEATAILQIGSRPLVDTMNLAFEEACSYIEAAYSAMRQHL